MGLLDPINPLSGLTGTPGVSELPGAESYVTGQGIQGGLNQLVDAISQRQNPLLAAGRVGLGFVGGQQQGMQNLANFQKLRQDLMKGGLDITQSKLNIGEKQFDLGRKVSQQQNLYNLIRNLSPDQKALALSNEEEFSKMMISNMQLTGSTKEYEYAVANGYTGSYTDYVKNVEKYRATNVSSTLKMPEKEKIMFEGDMKIYESIQGDASKSREIARRTRMINDVIGDMETGGLVKIKGDLQAFLGLNTEEASVAQVVDSLANVGATQVRTPGSGSTSDMEFGAYKRAFPSLATTKEGRILMVRVADANATRNAKLADWTRNAIRNDTFTNEGLAKFDNELGPAIPKDLKNDLNTFLGYDPMSGQEMQKSGFDFSKFDQEAGVTP